MSFKSLLTPGWIEPLTKRAWRYLIAEQETVAIPLARARVCVECEMVHQADRCPRCLGSAAVPLQRVFRNLEKALKMKKTKIEAHRVVVTPETPIISHAAIPGIAAKPSRAAAVVSRIENGKKKFRKAAQS